jgi:hypothetical protein
MPTGPDLEHPPTLTQRAVPSERFPLGRRSAPISVFPPQRLDLLLRDVGAVVATAPRISNVLVAPMPRPTLAGPPGPRPTGLNHGRYRRGGRGARGSPKRRRPLPVRFRGACREVARRVRGAQIPAAIVGMVKMPPRPRQDRLAAPRARHPAPLDEPAPALPCRLVGDSVCSRPFQSFVGPFFVGEGNPNRGAVARRLSPKKRSATHNPLPGKPPRPGLSPRLSYGGGWRPSPAERQPRPSWVTGSSRSASGDQLRLSGARRGGGVDDAALESSERVASLRLREPADLDAAGLQRASPCDVAECPSGYLRFVGIGGRAAPRAREWQPAFAHALASSGLDHVVAFHCSYASSGSRASNSFSAVRAAWYSRLMRSVSSGCLLAGGLGDGGDVVVSALLPVLAVAVPFGAPVVLVDHATSCSLTLLMAALMVPTSFSSMKESGTAGTPPAVMGRGVVRS